MDQNLITMKKIVVSLALILGLLAGAQAQEAVRFGFQLSPTFGWMSTDKNTVTTNGTNLGLKLGLIGEFYFQENYAVTAGLGFAFNAGGTLLHDRAGEYWIKSGNEIPDECRNFFRNNPPDLKTSIQYVEIPVGLKLRTREFGYLRYFVEPNLGLGFRTQATGDIRNAGDECNDLNIREDVALLNVFWGIGAGVEYSVSESTSLVGGIGTQFGFVDTSRGEDTVFLSGSGSDIIMQDPKSVVRAIVLRLGVMF
jgi:hypothetical protein